MGIKKSLGLIAVIVVFWFHSCNPEENEILIDYVIINQSGVEIRIESNSSIDNIGENSPRSDLILKNNETFSERIQFTNQNSNIDFRTFFGTDNIDVIFNNSRKVFFSCSSSESNNCDNPRNILKFGPDTEDRAEYTFTENDLENAEPCEGPCN